MTLAEIQDEIEKFVRIRDFGTPGKSVAQIQVEMKKFIQERDSRRYEKRSLNSNPNRKYDYIREGYSIRRIPRRDQLESNS